MSSCRSIFIALLLAPFAAAALGSDTAAASVGKAGNPASLPFDRELINRYSLDHLPRSLSIRQGKDVWLGYDLERAKLYKAWKALPGKPGLVASGFVTKSAGTTWFEDKSSETWQLQRAGKLVPLQVRYLGCSQRADHFELTWELRHEAAAVKLIERIPMAATPEERITRELRAEALAAGDTLLLPPAARQAWKLAGGSASVLSGADWHRLTLP